jgi:hypothetical protein
LLSKLQRSFTVLGLEKALEIDVAARCQQLLRDGSMPLDGGDVERHGTTLQLKINVTASFNELLRDGRIPMLRGDVERRAPIYFLPEINVAARFNQLLRNGSMPILGGDVEINLQRASISCFVTNAYPFATAK